MPTLTSMHSVNEGGAAGGNSNTNNNHNGNTFTVSNPLSRMRSNMSNAANNNGNQAGMIARSSFRSRMQGRLGAVVRSVAHASNSAGGNGNGGGGGGGGGLDGTVSSLGGANHNFMESDALFGPSFFSQQSRQRSFSRSNNNFAGSTHQQHQHHQQQHGNRVAATNFLQSGGGSSVNATSVDMTGDFFAEAGAATAVSTSISVNGTSTATITGARPALKPSISSSSPQANVMTVNEVSAVAVPSPSAGPALMIPPQQIPVVDEFDSEGDDDDDGAAGVNLHSSGSGGHDIPNRLASFATTLVPSGSADAGGAGGGSASRKKVLLSVSGNLANSGNGAQQISNVGTSTTLLSTHRRESDAIVMARTPSSIPLTRPARKHPTAHLKLQQQQQNGPISPNHHINSPHNSSSLTGSHGDNTTTPHANSAAEKMEGSWGVGSAENPLSGASFEQHESYHQEAQSGVQRIFNMVDVENRGWLSAEQVVKALRLFGMYVTVEEVLSMAEELLEIDELHQQQKMMQSESSFPSEHTWKRKSIALSSERRGFSGEGTMGRSMTLRPNETDNQFDFDDDGIAASMRRPTSKPSVSVEDSACVDPPPASLLPSPSHRSRKQGSSVKRHKQHHKVCVDFPMFEQIIRLWQGAARYRLFQDRAVESQAHMDSALDQYKHWIPDSTMMWFWQVWILLLSLYCFIVALCTHMYDASDPADAVMLTHLFYVTTTPDFFVTFFFAADIVVKFCSMVLEIDEHHNLLIVDDTKTIVRRYLFSVWFWIDLMSVIPLRFFFLFGGKWFELADTTNGAIAATDRMIPSGIGCVQSTCANFEQLQAALLAAKIATHFRVLKYFTHTTFFQESKLIPVSKLYILLFHVLAQGLIDMTRLVALTHLCAVVNVTFHMDGEKTIRPTTTQGPNPSSYVESLYVVLYMFSTCGYGDVGPTSRAHEIYYMFLMIVGMLINALLIGTIVTYLQRSDIENDRRTKLLEVSALMRYFHVPKSLEEEVLSFENYILQNDLLRTHSDKIGELPMDLQRNLELCTRLRTVQALPYIQDVHHSAKLQLCNLLVKVTYCPEEYVVYCGEVGEEMFFLNHGYVDIFAQNMLIATLKPGHYFGEMALISQEPLQRAADVKAITYCECYVLEKICFLEVALRYPRLRVAMSQVAAVRMQAIHDNQGPPSISEAIGAAHSPSDSERREDVSRKSYALTEGMAWLLSEFHPSGREPSGDFVKAESPGAVGFGSDIDDASNEHPNGSHETGPLEPHENEEDQASHRLVAVTSGVMMPSGPSFHLDLRPKKDQTTVGQEVHAHPSSEGTPAPVMAMRTAEGHSELFGGETPPEDAPPSPPQSSLPPPLPLVVTTITTTATPTAAGTATTLTHVLPMSPTSPTSGSSSLKSGNRLSPRTNNNNTTAGGAVKRTSGSGLIDGSASPPIAALTGWTNVTAVPSAGGGGFQSHASSSTSAAKLASTTSERPDAVRMFSPGSSSTALHFVMSSEAFANHGGVHPIAPPFGAHVAASNVGVVGAGGGVDPMETTTTNGSRNLVGRSAVANRLRRRSEHTMEMSMVRSSLPGYLDRSFVPAQLGTSSAHIAHADRVVASTPVAALGGASFTPAVLAAGYRGGVTAVPVGSGAVSPLMAADDLRTTEQLIAAHHAQQFDHMLDQIANENRAVAELLLQLEAGKHAQRQSP